MLWLIYANVINNHNFIFIYFFFQYNNFFFLTFSNFSYHSQILNYYLEWLIQYNFNNKETIICYRMHNKCHQIIQIIHQIITSQQVHQATNHQCNQCMVCHQMDNSCQCLQVVQCLPQVQMVQCHHHMVINQCHYHQMDNICQDNMYQL